MTTDGRAHDRIDDHLESEHLYGISHRSYLTRKSVHGGIRNFEEIRHNHRIGLNNPQKSLGVGAFRMPEGMDFANCFRKRGKVSDFSNHQRLHFFGIDRGFQCLGDNGTDFIGRVA